MVTDEPLISVGIIYLVQVPSLNWDSLAKVVRCYSPDCIHQIERNDWTATCWGSCIHWQSIASYWPLGMSLFNCSSSTSLWYLIRKDCNINKCTSAFPPGMVDVNSSDSYSKAKYHIIRRPWCKKDLPLYSVKMALVIYKLNTYICMCTVWSILR